jgi:phosphoglycolate phosphatase
VKETLERLAKEYRLFIVSNSQCGYPELCMEKLGIAHLMEGHMCFGDTGTEKGKTILTLMQRHNISSAVYIGDTQGDYEATLVAGIPFVWTTFGFGAPQGYAARVEDFRDLPQVLETM